MFVLSATGPGLLTLLTQEAQISFLPPAIRTTRQGEGEENWFDLIQENWSDLIHLN